MEDFWTPFLTYVLISAFTPGPNNLLALANAGTFGLRRSIPMLLGLASSFLLLMILCGLATTLLADWLPAIMPPLTVIGAVYILYLAWGLARCGCTEDKSNLRACGFRHAFILQFVNIKVILYGITSFTAFILPRTNDPWALLGFAALLAGAGHAANWTWAFAGNGFRRLFDRYGSIINPVLALLLAYSAIGLFF